MIPNHNKRNVWYEEAVFGGPLLVHDFRPELFANDELDERLETLETVYIAIRDDAGNLKGVIPVKMIPQPDID